MVESEAKRYTIYSHGLVGSTVKGSGPGVGYVKAYDPEAYDGQGDVTFTLNPDEALTFATAEDAIVLWQKVPSCRPLRDDGRLNRPLMAFTIEIRHLP